MARALKYLSIAVAGHGALVALFALAIAPRFAEDPPEPLASFVFFFLYVPASFLAKPLIPILWKFGLMEAPGWFAWPKPLGFCLVYAIWFVGLLALSLLVSRLAKAPSR